MPFRPQKDDLLFPLLLALAAALRPSASQATAETGQIVVDFASSQYFDAANPANTAWWDTLNRRIWTPMSVNGAPLQFGTGADGAFDGLTSQPGITVAGPNITIDTDARPLQQNEFHFTSFHLPAGTLLTVTGSRPLVLRVQGATTIEGEIRASGAPGGDANGLAVAAGGAANGGGGTGGAGSFNFVASATGTSASADSIGGGPGALSELPANPGDQSGGGGGCNGMLLAEPPNNASAGGSLAPSTNAASCAKSFDEIGSSFEATFAGGAGGGGGGGVRDTSAGTAYYNGGGGGGGGGAIRIVSLGRITLAPGGKVNVHGGNGGENTTDGGTGNGCGGGGGGGAGGTIWLQSLDNVDAIDGSIDIGGGAGGGALDCGGTFVGGNGSRGIFRVDTLAGTMPSYAAVAALETLKIGALGDTAERTFSFVSKPISLTSGYLSPGTPFATTSTCGSSGQLTILYEGSDDGIRFGTPVTADRIGELSGSAYLRFKVEITVPASTSVPPSPPDTFATPCLSALTIPYGPSNLSRMSFTGGLACATLQKDDGSAPPLGGAAAFARDLLLLVIAYLMVRRPHRRANTPC
ncbi:MAG: hypothetical protein NDJ90_01290 [Oligoflexia bacterium]|nr:hypothetical protein [Oligoflexia bacterium]